jgi:hypothetical protein
MKTKILRNENRPANPARGPLMRPRAGEGACQRGAATSQGECEPGPGRRRREDDPRGRRPGGTQER